MERNEAFEGLVSNNEHARFSRNLTNGHAADTAAVPPKIIRLGLTFAELQKEELPPREEIILGIARGEVGMLNAVTNAGKSTMVRNILLSICSGRAFPPFTNSGLPKKCALIDSEDTRVFLRSDLNKMMQSFSGEEQENVEANLLIMCDVLIGNEDLRINRPDHFDKMVSEIAAHGADLVVVDTISRSFVITKENDNCEVREQVMKPLKRLAVLTNCGVLSVHHIGKSKLEEGSARESTHRGRGASSFADQSRAIFNLEKDDRNQRVILSCPKVKGPKLESQLFKLNNETRWFEIQNVARMPTSYERVTELFTQDERFTTGEILKKLGGLESESSIKKNLARAIECGDLKRTRHGVYERVAPAHGQVESAKVQSA